MRKPHKPFYWRSYPFNPAAEMAAEDLAGRRVARLQRAAPAMYALLKELEWSHTVREYGCEYPDHCPVCRYMEHKHADDCRLAAVLKAVEGCPESP